MIKADVLADSTYKGIRATTFEATLPRTILAELKTHSMVPCSVTVSPVRYNAASSRAIPNRVLMERIGKDPFVPNFRKNQKGMQAGNSLEKEQIQEAEKLWLHARDYMLATCTKFGELDVHKQYVNRLLESWMWCTVIITATDWDNMYAQRYHPAAEPSYQLLAQAMWEASEQSIPEELMSDSWHLPLFGKNGGHVKDYDDVDNLTYGDVIQRILSQGDKVEISREQERALIDIYSAKRFDSNRWQDVAVGRCARISYTTHHGLRDVVEDIILALKLSSNDPGHWSPFEHVLTPASFEDMRWKSEQLTTVTHYQEMWSEIIPKDGEIGYCGPYRGMKSYRHTFPQEYIMEWKGPNVS